MRREKRIVKIMKVFVYAKKESKKVAEIKNVSLVREIREKHEIQLTTESNEVFKFDTHLFKTTVYQN